MGRLVGWLGLALAWLGWIHFVSQVNSLQVLNDSLFCRSLHSSEHSNYREGWQVKPNGSKSQKFSGQLECKLLHKMCQTLPTQNTCQTASEQTQKLQSKSVTAKRKQDREKPKKRQRNYQKKKIPRKPWKIQRKVVQVGDRIQWGENWAGCHFICQCERFLWSSLRWQNQVPGQMDPARQLNAFRAQSSCGKRKL